VGKAELLARAATYDDLRKVPDHQVAEILGGDLWVSPRPAMAHAHTAAMLAVELVAPFGQGRGGPGGWWILPECEVHLHGDVLVPDFAGWRHANLKERSSSHSHMTQAPDWVCEIVSPSTQKIDRTLKLGIYAREGVRHVWLVEPLKRTLEVLKLAGGVYVAILMLHGDAVASAEPFDAVPFPLKRIWPEI
jgi:Uma2 family endonuclease